MEDNQRGQTQIKSDPVQHAGSDHLSEFIEKFEKARTTKPKTRTVKLQWRKCNNCTCRFKTIERTVPYDSDLHDGDKLLGINNLIEGDKFI